MPFDTRSLRRLTTANGFTLWHYRTQDERAVVLAASYFDEAAAHLRPGDVVIVHAADATAILPIREGPVAGAGVTLDSSGTGLRLVRSSSQAFSVTLSAAAVVKSIVLGPLPNAPRTGDPLPVTATVSGPIARIMLRLLDSGGAEVQPPQSAVVAAGFASAAFTAPAPGSGYRIQASDADDPAMAVTSPPFAVIPPPRLLAESGASLLQESGAALLL